MINHKSHETKEREKITEVFSRRASLKTLKGAPKGVIWRVEFVYAKKGTPGNTVSARMSVRDQREPQRRGTSANDLEIKLEETAAVMGSASEQGGR